MDEQPTAWEEINPVTDLVPQLGPRLPSLDRLQPATNEAFRNELTACLALVVPVGMTEESRREWLAVAWKSLDHLPADVLAMGCKIARQKCDHPSKIVPTIIAETKEMMGWRKDIYSQPALPAPTKKHVMDRRGEPMSDDDTEKLNGILENLGATARYRSDGSRYLIGDTN